MSDPMLIALQVQSLPPLPLEQEEEVWQATAVPATEEKIIKHLTNKTTNRQLLAARAEVNSLKLRKKVKAFVLMMHKMMPKNKTDRKETYPWSNYLLLSKEWSKPEYGSTDCLLPEISNLNLLLREMSAKILKKIQKKTN